VTRELRALDPELPLYDLRTMDDRVRDSLARRRFSMGMLGVFAGVALALAALGIFGVITYWTSQRTREIGIRMALGAPRGSILRLVVRQAVVLVGIGIGLGLVAAFALTRVMASLLFGIRATDGLTFGVLPAVLGAVALLASYGPARRASRVDPIVAVRSD
jgi:ABC-type antimicrobial peptide transport system permease subunit